MVWWKRPSPDTELLLLHFVQTERIQPTTPLHATPRALEIDLVLPNTRLPIFLVQQGRFSETSDEQTTCARYRTKLRTQSGKAKANQNCFWPVTQTMADTLLRASKRIIRYVALYSMAGVDMESRLFRIRPSARDTPFIDACAAFLTPKMDLSQVMPSGCKSRQVAQPPRNQLAVQDRPSASDYQEEEETIDPEDMHMAITAPVFQPYRGATGRAWMAQEYGLAVETSSLLSSGTEREETDDEVCSFDLGPEPFDPSGQNRLPSDE